MSKKMEDKLKLREGGIGVSGEGVVHPRGWFKTKNQMKNNMSKTYVFGVNRTNVWNHEWCEQFVNYVKKETMERRKYYEEVIIPLFKEENPNWETVPELRERVIELYQMVVS